MQAKQRSTRKHGPGSCSLHPRGPSWIMDARYAEIPETMHESWGSAG